MAGDWIKMRAAILEHPKLIAVARAIHRNKDFREWLTPGGSGDLNGQIVSTRALRCVTASLLMRVWSVSREHGEFVGNDLLLRHSEICDLDQMAGAPGIGEAMLSVHWAVEENGVTLPNFKEFNVPMSPAEKQKEYRKRNEQGNTRVTSPLPNESNENTKNVTTRVEKRRTNPIVPTPDFDRFWEVWPKSERKGSKSKCLAEWIKAGINGHADEVIAHVEDMKQSRAWTENNGKFIPAPLVYLNRRAWDGAEKPSGPESGRLVI